MKKLMRRSNDFMGIVVSILSQVQGSSVQNFFEDQNHQPTNCYIIVNPNSTSYNVNDASMTV